LHWVVTGCRGQLGRALVERLAAAPGEELLSASDLPELDVTDPGAVERLFAGLPRPPDVLVNAAAFTAVDRCETEPETARRANGEAPGILAGACRQAGCRMVHVSTDYVFAGDASRPYREDDPPDPRSAYGRSKLDGERRVLAASPEFLVVRTSWVFGHGHNFVRAVLAQAEARRSGEASGPLRVVDDQHGRPTYAGDLAGGLLALLERRARGLYHLANRGVATWWSLARAALDEAGFADLAIERAATADLSLPAPRPAWSVLDCSKSEALGVRLRSWREALIAYLQSDASPAVHLS
jgi:dTDP-4-dehydrorhamnose reductase